MKKLSLMVSMAFAICQTNAQQLLNNGFETTRLSPITQKSSINNWFGEATPSTEMTGNATNSLKLSAELTPNFGPRVCVAWGKPNNNCVSWINGEIISYSLYKPWLNQTLAIDSMPIAVTGKYQYSATSANFNSMIIVSGNQNSIQFADTLLISDIANTAQNFNLTIGKNSKPCMQQAVNQCAANANTIVVSFVACGTCPSVKADKATLLVDDVRIKYDNLTGMESSTMQQNLVYPNPAKDIIYVNGKVGIYNLEGRLLTTGEDKIDISNLSQGVYLVKKDGKNTKLIKE